MALIDIGKLQQESFKIQDKEIEKFPINAEHIIPRSEQARAWRDAELKVTDWIVPIIDHPNHEATLLYRVALRDWPSTDNFPLTKPIM
tara:strand:+ start:1224 stop:1487 length:264 start_codon:yes stop_codon:yes gene_type:complete